jgi:hypothetical protein
MVVGTDGSSLGHRRGAYGRPDRLRSHPRPQFADWILGWTATEVTKQARCEVLIVRPDRDEGRTGGSGDAPSS